MLAELNDRSPMPISQHAMPEASLTLQRTKNTLREPSRLTQCRYCYWPECENDRAVVWFGLETGAVNFVPPIATPYRSETVTGDFD
jgi:hypothetical protein